MKVAAVVGVGPGLGIGIARALARDGFRVGIFSRNHEKLCALQRDEEAVGEQLIPIQMDVSDEASVERGFAELRAAAGGDDVECLVYNAGMRRMRPRPLMETDAAMFEKHWRVNCMGAFLCARQVWPGMMQRRKGAILMTGATAAWRGIAGMSNFSVGKFGLRSLCQTLAAEGNEHNIHVCHVVVDGPVDMPLIRKVTGRSAAELISPDQVGELYVHLVNQPATCWTSELDVHIPAKL